MIRTRQQQFMQQAAEHIIAVAEEEQRENVKKIYGGLCHALPPLLRQNGLCQTVAYIEDKGSGQSDRGCAYRLLRAHIAATLGVEPAALAEHVRCADLRLYLRDTETLLEAWVYYKRFAVSILKVTSDQRDDPDTGSTA
jgi:CRISPR-associated protein Cmr5